MDLPPVEPDFWLKRHRAVEAAIASGEAAEAIELYLEHYASLRARATLEWRLFTKFVSSPKSIPDVRWPPGLAQRPSGACLVFAVAQTSGRDCELPEGFRELQRIPRRYRQALANAWLLRPDTPCLTPEEVRRGFALNLIEDAANLGLCLIAAKLAGDDELTAELGERWLERGLTHDRAPRQIAAVSRIGGLGAQAVKAVMPAFGIFLNDTQALLELAEAASNLDAFEQLFEISELLLPRTLPADAMQRLRALRLVALAGDPVRHLQAAEEYRQHWLGSSAPFPWPERLLYVFQRLGETELEHHLLNTAEMSDETPPWVVLAREGARERPNRRHLEAWATLYEEEGRDERVLVGVTSAVLRQARPLRREWIDRLGLLQRWEGLAVYDGYRGLAGSFLVRLQGSDEERVAAFEQWLSKAPLATHAERMAARSYVAALRRTRRLHRLRGARGSKILSACPYEVSQLIEVLARLQSVPETRSDERRWCEGWERLIGLEVTAGELVEILDHFLNLSRQVEANGHLQHEYELYEDVSLQLLRRAKAEAEHLLDAAGGDRIPGQHLRQRLERADLAATYRILQELIVTNLEEPADV